MGELYYNVSKQIQAATGAANGHYISKDWARALAYFEISIAGTRCTAFHVFF